jgi:hypothetical protein
MGCLSLVQIVEVCTMQNKQLALEPCPGRGLQGAVMSVMKVQDYDISKCQWMAIA